MRTPKLGEQLGSLGEFIAAQRRAAELSLRQLAEQTGISNPYLSQIERGLRRPSAEVLQQLAKALRVSAETLYVRAGILDPEDHPATTVEMAVLADSAITERQKRVLIDVYSSFVKENEKAASRPPTDRPPDPPDHIRRRTSMPRKQTPAQARKAALESDFAAAVRRGRPDRRPGRGAARPRWPTPRSAVASGSRRSRAAHPSCASRPKDSADELRTFVITLPDQVRNLPESTRARLAELQKQANELVAQANSAYGELAGRGKRVVDTAVGSARDLSGKAEKRVEDVLAEAGERIDPAFERVQEGVTKARRP